MSAFYDMMKSEKFATLRLELKSIQSKGRPRVSCPKWFAEGIEQGNFAYQTNTGWKVTQLGDQIINPKTPIDVQIENNYL